MTAILRCLKNAPWSFTVALLVLAGADAELIVEHVDRARVFGRATLGRADARHPPLSVRGVDAQSLAFMCEVGRWLGARAVRQRSIPALDVLQLRF